MSQDKVAAELGMSTQTLCYPGLTNRYRSPASMSRFMCFGHQRRQRVERLAHVARLVECAWIEAGTELDIVVETPLVLPTGRIVRVPYLPHFGGRNGMAVLSLQPPFDADSEAVAEELRPYGYYLSCVNARRYSRFEREHFIETLVDWGYTGPATVRPTWLDS